MALRLSIAILFGGTSPPKFDFTIRKKPRLNPQRWDTAPPLRGSRCLQIRTKRAGYLFSTARLWFEKQIWHDGAQCPHCQSRNVQSNITSARQ